jgi:starch phosphorylase
VLGSLGIQPSVFHGNEGHTSFMLLERVREMVLNGMTFEEAPRRSRHQRLYHAYSCTGGHDAFPLQMMEKHFAGYWDDLGITQKEFMDLGSTSTPST